MELCGALKNNYFERCQVSAPLLVSGAATFHSLEDDAILTHRLSEDVDSGVSQNASVKTRVDQATSLSQITSEMYLSKQDPRLMEEATMSGDLERYKRAVAAMKYYGARVGAGVARGDTRHISAALPATLPAASRLVYVPGECYYAANGDASDTSSRDDFSQQRRSPQRLSPQRMSPQRPSQQILSPGCLSPDGWSHKRLSPQHCRSPSQLSPLRYPLGEDRSTKRTLSSPVKYTINQQPPERAGRSPPGRTRIPVANTSRMSVKETNMAYFAPSPPDNPLPAVFHAPSMCQRRDVKHSCLASGHAQARAVNGDTVRLCERAVAEAVRAGRDPSQLPLPPAALQCIPPRRSVDHLKDKTVSLRQRIDQFKSKRSDNVKNKEASKELPKLNNIMGNGTFDDRLINLNSKKEILSENLETLDSMSPHFTEDYFQSQEIRNKEISNEGLGNIDTKIEDIFVEDLENQNLKGGEISNCLENQMPNKKEIFNEVFECQDSGCKNFFIDRSESADSMRSNESTPKELFEEHSESQHRAKSEEISKQSNNNLDLNRKETKEEMRDNDKEVSNALSKSITRIKEAYMEQFINKDEHIEEDYKEVFAGPNKEEDSSNDLTNQSQQKVDFPSGDNRETQTCLMRQGVACWTPAVGAAGECGGCSLEPEDKDSSLEPKNSGAGLGSSEGPDLHGTVPSDLTLKNSLSNLSSVLPVDMLAEGLLIDILQKFSSHEDLCTDLRTTKAQCTPEVDGKPGEKDVFAATNRLLKRRLSQLDEESCDGRRDADTSEFSGYDTTNSRDEGMLSAHLSRMARSIVEQTGEEFIIDTAPPTPEEWRGTKERNNSSDHSAATEWDSVETKSPTYDRYKSEETDGEVTTDASMKSELDRKGVMRRTYSRSKAVQVCSFDSFAGCDKTKSHLVLNKYSSHREVETKVSQHPQNEELACVPKRSMSGRRLLADLKRSQRMLGMVDAVLNDETATSSDGTRESARRVRSRRAVPAPSAHPLPAPRDLSHCSACQTPSGDAIGGSECMRQLQVLRNEQLRHIQRQVQQIVKLNKFIDAYQ